MTARLKLWLPLAVLAAGALLAAGILATRPRPARHAPEAPVPLVRVVEAALDPVRLSVHTHGTVAPRTESELVPEVSGPVVWVAPALVSGGFFASGDPLLRIDPTDFEVALEQARANLARAESEARRASREQERQRTLAERDVASAARLDEAETAARVAEAAVRQARAALRKAELDLARTEIRAPYPGRVREERVDVGQFVARGQPVATLYATDYAEVRLPIADDQLAFLDLPLRGDPAAAGPAVELRADFAGRTHVWRGRVVRTEGEIDPRSRMVHAVARVDDPYGEAVDGRAPLHVGLFVDAEIEGRTLPAAAVLPREALREGDRVLVVDGDDRLRFRAVQVARLTREHVIVGAGLAAGERVCISPLATPVDGMAVRVARDAPESAS